MKRFWDKVNKISGGCWEWQAGCCRGYGAFYLDKRHIKAHRYSAFLAGLLPSLDDKQLVCHRCDNRKCVNPDHLFLGSYKDNAQDCLSKKRKFLPRGEKHPKCKLTNEKVLQMRKLHSSGMSQKEIAAQFGIKKSRVSSIILRQTWCHIE